MSITIKNLIIHQIHKDQPQTGQQQKNATLTEAKITTPTLPGDNWHKLVEAVLKNTNDDRRLRRGRFDKPKGFKDEYDDYLLSIYDFIKLSTHVTSRLMKKMDSSPMSTGGFILFADITDKHNTNHFYSIMFKKKMADNLEFNLKTKSFDLKSVIFLDLEKMHQGFCLEVTNYNNAKKQNILFDDSTKPYLYFINMQKSDKTKTSDYFINTFGCIVTQNAPKSMTLLLEKTAEHFNQSPNLVQHSNSIRTDIQNYYHTCHSMKQDVKLSEVEQIITKYTAQEKFTQPDQKLFVDNWFQDLVHDPRNPISAVFSVDSQTLASYETVKLKINGFQFSGQKDALLKSQPSDQVYYDKGTTITITLPNKIN